MTCICDVWEEYDEREEGAVWGARTSKRHRDEQGAGVETLRAVGDASISTGKSDKRRG